MWLGDLEKDNYKLKLKSDAYTKTSSNTKEVKNTDNRLHFVKSQKGKFQSPVDWKS